MTTSKSSRRGRPRTGERAQRQQRVVTAALNELIERGYERVTMLAIASRAGASKETLYNWFGSKESLFAALIKANADQSAFRGREALDANTGRQTSYTKHLTLPSSSVRERWRPRRTLDSDCEMSVCDCSR
jgi:AcrR family transcriptional regulator